LTDANSRSVPAREGYAFFIMVCHSRRFSEGFGRESPPLHLFW